MTSILERGRRASVRFATRAAIALGVAMGLVAVTAAGCGADNGVVGGVCAPGFTECSVRCVDLATDNDNCGVCGHVCDPSSPCAGGVCGFDATVDDGGGDATIDAVDDPLDERPRCDSSDPCRTDCRPPVGAVCDDAGEAGPGYDASVDGSLDASFDGSTDGAPPGDGSTDTGTLDGSGGADSGPVDATTTDACTPPYNTVVSCGSCNHNCLNSEVCALDGTGMYTCQPKCAPPLVNCGGRCVNLLRDPFNCGQCFNVCPSRLCLLATCQGAVAGNVVVIGHDYRQSAGTSQQSKLLYNAIFLNNTTSLRVFSFEHYADAQDVQIIKANVAGYATTHNVTVTYTVSNDDSDIPNDVLKSTQQDVVLIYDQSLAPRGRLAPLGASWAAKLSSFAIGGGIVIAMDGGQGVHQMPAFVTSAALFNTVGSTILSQFTPVKVIATNDALSRGLVSQYAVELNSVRFVTSEPQSAKTIFVVVDPATNDPVVVHKIVN